LKFGKGKIIEIDNDKALIDFGNFVTKKIYLKFLKIID
tara:strand:- start:169 stop:282 length:114 start_codon:yes stop_codon:yes gene_type:complete